MEKILEIKKRTNRYEKEKFLAVLEEKLSALGFECHQDVLGGISTKVNLSTKCENPDYIFIAHYDTGNIMPFWIDWLFRIIGVNRQLLMIGIIIFWSKYFMPWLEVTQEVVATSLSFIFGLSFFSILFPNPKNFDDNTSGVITLLTIAELIKQKNLDNIQLLFVDKEEKGLLGSFAQYRKMKNDGSLKNNPKVISIDCVGGRGEIPLIVRNGKSSYEKEFADLIEKGFGKCKSIRTLLPLSDSFAFRKLGALNISFVSKSLIPGGYFIKGIHSPMDKFLKTERIEKLAKLLVNEIE